MDNIFKLRPAVSTSTMNSTDSNQFEGYSRKDRIIQIIIDTVAIIFLFIIYIIVVYAVDPKIREFTCGDRDIFFPKTDDDISVWVVALYGILGPIIIILIVELYNAFFRNDKIGRFRTFLIISFHSLSLFFLGMATVLLLTEIGKKWVGRLRPYFMSVCNPIWANVVCLTRTQNGNVFNSISTGVSFCTGNADDIEEARLSFPSGRSSFSWYTMLFTVIYLEARLILIRLRYVKSTLQITCFITAFVTMFSLISSYHNHGSDVLGGLAIGVFVALLTTLVFGRVLWRYDKKCDYLDPELKN